jgi:multimeric flavodoxin WrbA
MYGHTYTLAQSVVEGVREAGGKPILKQVEELMPAKYWDESVKKAKDLMKSIPVADPRSDLKGIDGVIVGTPTRYGNMTAQMRNFWDQTGGDWVEGTRWEASRRIHQYGHAAWRSGDHNYLHHADPSPSWLRFSGLSIFL